MVVQADVRFRPRTQPSQTQSPNPPEAPSINGRYHHVVRVECQWAELSCGICGANYDDSSQQFFKGLRGLHAHTTGPAHELQANLADILSHCSKRIVSDRGVGIMLSSGSRKPVDCAISQRKYGVENTSELEQSDSDNAGRTRKRMRTVDSDTSGLTRVATTDSDTIHISSGA